MIQETANTEPGMCSLGVCFSLVAEQRGCSGTCLWREGITIPSSLLPKLWLVGTGSLGFGWMWLARSLLFAFSSHKVFLMASCTNLCCSFLDKFMLNSISAISISCLFRISCFCFSQPCGVNLSYEIQMSSSCFLPCNTSFPPTFLLASWTVLSLQEIPGG